MKEHLTNCKACGAEMASSAGACPRCGAKNRKPFYKKWWFWALIVLVAAGALGGQTSSAPAGTADPPAAAAASSSGAASAPEPVSYAAYNVTELFDALSDNAMNAQQTYEGQYVEITGYLGTIDASGKYIGVNAGSRNYDYFLQEVHCTLKNDGQRQAVAAMQTDDPITVRGKIQSVGEVMGYTLAVDSIN